MKRINFVLALLLMIISVQAAFAAGTEMTDYEQDIEKNCIRLKIKTPAECEYISVIAERIPVEKNINAEELSENMVAVAQVKPASSECVVELFYEEKDINTDKLYICISADGAEYDRFTVEFKTREQTVLDSFKNAASWNVYESLIKKYNNAFNMFVLSDGSRSKLYSLSETLRTEVYKTMYKERSGFSKTADIEKAYISAIDSAYAKLPKNSSGQGGGGGGSTPNKTLPYVVTDNSGKENVTENTDFNDMNGYDWAADAVRELRKRHIISGVSETEFNPGGNVKREDFAKILISAAGYDLSGSTDVFEDVRSGEYYEKYVNAAYEHGIVNGIDNAMFGIGMPITRQDIAVMLYRAFFTEKDPIIEHTDFTDSGEISAYAQEAVSALVRARVINGMEDGSFRPMEYASRAQAAQLIYKLISIGRL